MRAGLDLGAGLYCLSCEEGLQLEQRVVMFDSSQVEGTNLSNQPVSDDSDRKRRGLGKTGAAGEIAPKLYSCSLCAFSSRYSNHLKRHMRTHDGQKPYRCPICPYASAQRVNLQRHARTHTGEKPYRCHQCSYACSSLGNLRRHQRMHSQERPQRREKEKRRARRKKTDGETEQVKEMLLARHTFRMFRVMPGGKKV
uniref:C2H2-type domain-containing protein n=1 Tax=Myripristis murdjan TaxID=586833 RepID=A0A667XJU0_9TELE